MKQINYKVGEKVYVYSRDDGLRSGWVTINKIIGYFAYSDDLPENRRIFMAINAVVGYGYTADLEFGFVLQPTSDWNNDTDKPLLATIIQNHITDDRISYEVLAEIAEVLERNGYDCKI